MGIPLIQQIRVGAYVVKQRLMGIERYPLVLMLEPLYRCNLECAGCGKIQFPTPILNMRLSTEDCLAAVPPGWRRPQTAPARGSSRRRHRSP